MRIAEKVAHLKEHHLGEWLRVRKEVDERVSRSFSMMCICGRLCTGLHERSCKRFIAKVDSETAKELKHLLDQKPEEECQCACHFISTTGCACDCNK